MGDLSARLVRNVIFPVWVRRDHPQFLRYYREYERTQFLSRAELEAMQLERLKKLAAHAYTNCRFYRERMDKAGIHPQSFRSLEQYASLPLLTKRNIQDNGETMLASNIPAAARVRNQTGGSTGSPLQFYVDRERLDSRRASTTRHDAWAGLRPGDWCAHLWGARLDQVGASTWWDRWRNALLYRMVELNTSEIKEEYWSRFLRGLRAKRPRTLLCYAQSAVLFAQYLRENRISDIAFDSVITTAEVLLPEQRALLEETFGARVFERYGCREVSIIASECAEHRGMHCNSEAILVEIVRDPSLPQDAGRVVITDLLNTSQPLLRYEIGDVGSWAVHQNCPCGRGLPLIANIQGRTTDFLIMPDGRKISGPALTLVSADMPEVRQVQFVQTARDAVLLRVVPGRAYGAQTEQELRRRFGLYLKGAATLRVEEVESIASEASGKYRFVIQEMGAKEQHGHH